MHVLHAWVTLHLLSCVLSRPSSQEVAMIFSSASKHLHMVLSVFVCVCLRQLLRGITAACDDRAARSN